MGFWKPISFLTNGSTARRRLVAGGRRRWLVVLTRVAEIRIIKILRYKNFVIAQIYLFYYVFIYIIYVILFVQASKIDEKFLHWPQREITNDSKITLTLSIYISPQRDITNDHPTIAKGWPWSVSLLPFKAPLHT